MNAMKKTQVLLGSPIHQKPPILRQFLDSLLRLKLEQLELDFYLIDDNEDKQSSSLLEEFKSKNNNVFLQSSGYKDPYIRDDTTHFWNANLVWKVANFKNMMIQRAALLDYDYLFLIDSDLILHPHTLEHLAAMGKDIISEVFWTQWQPDTMLQPQVWMHDEYSQWERLPGEQLSAEEISYRFNHFLTKLRIPGVYEVGGLGACTLISRHAIETGVSYNIIKNISYWGEDRHFCIRAAALGIPLYVDTHYPALHLYRDSDLSKVEEFIQSTAVEPVVDSSEPAKSESAPAAPSPVPADRKRPKLTLTMVVKNESPRFLRQVLEEHRKYIDEAVIIDDGSTDDTAALCLETLKDIPVHMVYNKVSKFSNEIELRKQQWEEVVKTEPEWILNLDGDEMFEDRFAVEIDTLLREDNIGLYCFRLYDFWNKDHYREDAYWRSHLSYRPFLLRYNKDFNYVWNDFPQHCGRFPENIFELPHQLSDLRLKHLGWSKPEFRLEKYLRYMHLDPEGQYGWKEQYLSILDQHPNLVPWVGITSGLSNKKKRLRRPYRDGTRFSEKYKDKV
ncbi:glycosyltransferase family 2 protein [Paenibacillus sp. BR2-3]|uniref:glycosyltransferase family 2 protein n=1 Tax=Paenibacillus sp. BR2-3 TaxID=3048494 RepID=UPI003977C2EF